MTSMQAHETPLLTPLFIQSPSRRRLIAGAAALAFAPLASHAQSAFSKQITWVIPSAAGGGSDAVARALAPLVSASLGQPIVIENKLGAGGSIAATAVARAPADGHTFLLGSSATHGSNPSLFKTLQYDPIKDFVPVAAMGSFLFGLVVNPEVPAQNVKELVAYAKANPGKLSYAGVSSTSIVMTETFLRGANIDVLKVPHKSAALALPDLIAGRISMAVLDLATAGPMIQDKKLRLLAITSAERSSAAQDVPTIAEAAVPGFEVESWIGLFAPARTPAAPVDQMNAAVRSALSRPEIRARFNTMGFDIRQGTVDSFRAFVPREIDKFTRLVKAAGIQPE